MNFPLIYELLDEVLVRFLIIYKISGFCLVTMYYSTIFTKPEVNNIVLV